VPAFAHSSGAAPKLGCGAVESVVNGCCAGSIRVCARFGSPRFVHGSLLIHANLCRYSVPIGGDFVENLLGIVTRPQLADSLAQSFLVLVGLDQGQIQQTCLGSFAQCCQIVLPGLVKCESRNGSRSAYGNCTR